MDIYETNFVAGREKKALATGTGKYFQMILGCCSQSIGILIQGIIYFLNLDDFLRWFSFVMMSLSVD